MTHIFDTSDATTDGEGHKNIFSSTPDYFSQIIAAIKAGHRVYINQLVGTVQIIFLRESLGVAHDAQPFKMYTLDEILALNIQPGYQSDHYSSARSLTDLVPQGPNAIFVLPQMRRAELIG
ncbi:MAG: hypothetical protein BWY75_03562 [bacterium ADurb.Bin425]|nr:MAG: hypothetical protein BWY75_03562 [bacterium ADurb.Bin425]